MTSPPLSLRPYQVEAVQRAVDAERRGVLRAAEVLPTGAGKTVIIAGVVAQHVRQRSMVDWGARKGAAGRRVLVLAHREELVQQNANTIRRFAPHLRVGIVKAERDQTTADVISASVQSLVSKRGGRSRMEAIKDVGLVVVDEAHHAAADTYMRVLHHFGCFPPAGQDGVTRPEQPWAFGVTATMVRGDERALGDVWQDIVYTRSIAQMIGEGWLVRPRGLRVRVPDLDLRKVKKSHGDYSDASLGEAIEGSLAPELVAKAYAEHAARKQGILFAPTVHTAELYRDALRDVGITAELVHGGTPADERRRILRRFEDGAIQVLCNCAVFTEGTDLPMAEVCVIGRPTMSKGLFIQMAGRVLRLHPGKDSALIMDVSGATERHSLLAAVELFGEQSVTVPEDGEAPEGAAPDEPEISDPLMPPTGLDGEIDDGPTWLTGPTEAVEVDLFHGSRSMWQRTHAGVWFISAKAGRDDEGRYIIVQRAVRPGAWDVIEMAARTRGRSSWVATDVDDLSYAMAYADGNVSAAEQMTARKNARWRKQAPSDAQRVYAERMGIVVGEMSKGELSEAIDVVVASARIDPFIPAYARAVR